MNNKDVVETVLGGCVVAVVAVVMAVPAVLLSGFVLTKLWLWFAVSLGLKSLSFWHACGFATLVGLLHRRMPAKEAAPEKDEQLGYFVQVFFYLYLAPLLSLAAGYIFHCLM